MTRSHEEADARLADQDCATALDAQQEHWNQTFAARPEMFGQTPSYPATIAALDFTKLGPPPPTILELGSGQGRDTLFFAQRGFRVVALDYSDAALDALGAKAETLGIADNIEIIRQDVRVTLPFPDGTFDACYSHMLYCMALTEGQLTFLSSDVRRVLKPGGLSVYTVRTTSDPDFRLGTHHAENLYEDEGFVVHFFDRDLVKRLAVGFNILRIEEFEEGSLPRKLFLVTLQKDDH